MIQLPYKPIECLTPLDSFANLIEEMELTSGVTFSPPFLIALQKTFLNRSQTPKSPVLSPGTYSPEDDPLAVAVLQGASELRG